MSETAYFDEPVKEFDGDQIYWRYRTGGYLPEDGGSYGRCATHADATIIILKRKVADLQRESDARAERIAELEAETTRLHNRWHAAEERANKLRADFNAVAEESCQLQDAIGCPCELPDAQTKAMARIRDLIAAEGELGDTRAENAKLREALVDPFSLLGRAILAKVTGHVGCGEGDEWCDEVMEEAKKLGLVRYEPYNPEVHGEGEWIEGRDFIWWWGFLPQGWQTGRPPIEFLNVSGEPETDPSKCGFLRINDRQALAGKEESRG